MNLIKLKIYLMIMLMSFINRKFDAKLSGNKRIYHLSELMLNSLYGKMGVKHNLAHTDIVSLSDAKGISFKHRVLDRLI